MLQNAEYEFASLSIWTFHKLQPENSSTWWSFLVTEDSYLIGIMTEIDSMEKRHKQEIRDLEGKVRALLKTAKKSTKAAVEAEAIQMGYDLKTRQKEEYELISSMEGVF